MPNKSTDRKKFTFDIMESRDKARFVSESALRIMFISIMSGQEEEIYLHNEKFLVRDSVNGHLLKRISKAKFTMSENTCSTRNVHSHISHSWISLDVMFQFIWHVASFTFQWRRSVSVSRLSFETSLITAVLTMANNI